MRRPALRAGPTGGFCRRSMSPHFFIPPLVGGCEGLAMLNRTNRTLSANLNRLNLGTRSLDLQASANFGDQTLRIRHAHAVVMRDGMSGAVMDPISIGTWRITDISGSSPVRPRPPAGCVVSREVELTAQVVPVTTRSATSHGRPTLHGESQRQSRSRCSRERAKSSRRPFTGKRLHESRSGGAYPADRAALAAHAASAAAAGG